MEREEIDGIVCKIMINDGPDRHVDGHEIITDFIVCLLGGEGELWDHKYDRLIEQREENRKGVDIFKFFEK